jgi:hypothetical protein
MTVLRKTGETFPNRPHPTYRNTHQQLNEDTTMQNETRASVSTKATKDGESIRTSLVINWEGCTVEEIQAMAQQALIVKLQSGWRKNGIPESVTVKAADHKVGQRAPAKSILEKVATLTPEQKAELLKMLQG